MQNVKLGIDNPTDAYGPFILVEESEYPKLYEAIQNGTITYSDTVYNEMVNEKVRTEAEVKAWCVENFYELGEEPTLEACLKALKKEASEWFVLFYKDVYLGETVK
mgnify:CR=1 FL=1